jgi:uncharacterized cupredoxin-like copper-binding protein
VIAQQRRVERIYEGMSIKSFRTVGFSLLMVFMLAFVAACGDDDDDNGNGNGNGGSITIETPGMSYDPDSFSINAGEDFEVTIDNTDNQMHTFTIDELDVDLEVGPGESDSVTLNVSDADEYIFYCTVPGHRESGQEGVLTVN